jgi:hypothetical protein
MHPSTLLAYVTLFASAQAGLLSDIVPILKGGKGLGLGHGHHAGNGKVSWIDELSNANMIDQSAYKQEQHKHKQWERSNFNSDQLNTHKHYDNCITRQRKRQHWQYWQHGQHWQRQRKWKYWQHWQRQRHQYNHRSICSSTPSSCSAISTLSSSKHCHCGNFCDSHRCYNRQSSQRSSSISIGRITCSTCSSASDFSCKVCSNSCRSSCSQGGSKCRSWSQLQWYSWSP